MSENLQDAHMIVINVLYFPSLIPEQPGRDEQVGLRDGGKPQLVDH